MSATRHNLEELLPSDRRFGLFWSAVGAGVAAIAASMGSLIGAGAGAIVCLLLLWIALATPHRLHRLNLGWLRLGLALSQVVNPVVMGVLYFGLLTPVGLVLRALGRDELRLRRPRSHGSLWSPRRPDARGAGSFKDQY